MDRAEEYEFTCSDQSLVYVGDVSVLEAGTQFCFLWFFSSNFCCSVQGRCFWFFFQLSTWHSPFFWKDPNHPRCFAWSFGYVSQVQISLFFPHLFSQSTHFWFLGKILTMQSFPALKNFNLYDFILTKNDLPLDPALKILLARLADGVRSSPSSLPPFSPLECWTTVVFHLPHHCCPVFLVFQPST